MAGIFAKRSWQPYFPPSYATGMRAKSESSKPWLSNVEALRRSRESNYVTFHNYYEKFRRQFGAQCCARGQMHPLPPRVAPLEWA